MADSLAIYCVAAWLGGDISRYYGSQHDSMKYFLFLVFVLGALRSDYKETSLDEEAEHWCSHELHRHVMVKVGRLLEF